MVRIISCLVLVAILFCSPGVGQGSQELGGIKDKNTFATNQCFAKGGIGIIRKDLYVDLKSTKNELRLDAGKRWTGQGVPTPEVVTFFEGRIWSAQALPPAFDLSKTIVVSFESDKVRFFDFGKMSGGYYLRPGLRREEGLAFSIGSLPSKGTKTLQRPQEFE